MAERKRIRKFQRETERPPKLVYDTPRVPDILDTIRRYRFIPTSAICALTDGYHTEVKRTLQALYHGEYVNRFAFPVLHGQGEFQYYLDNLKALELLSERRGYAIQDADRFLLAHHRKKRYSDILLRPNDQQVLGSLMFLHHEVMISRFHALLELATQNRTDVILQRWVQGTDTWDQVEAPSLSFDKALERVLVDETDPVRLPVRPDAFFTLYFPGEPEGANRASFFYEADRQRTEVKKWRRKIHAYWYYIVRHKRFQEKYHVPRVRGVLTDTLNAEWAGKLHEATVQTDPKGKGSPLFWFSVTGKVSFDSPGQLFDRIWVAGDRKLYSLLDP